MLVPPPLRRGDPVRVIAPSSPFDPEVFARGLEVLDGQGEARVAAAGEERFVVRRHELEEHAVDVEPRHDVARRTVRQSGLTRFTAVCLLSGYFWLAVSGVLAVYFGTVLAGAAYDAIL